MLKARNIDREAAPFPWAAIKNAEMRNAVNASNYSQQQKAKAMGMQYALELCVKCDATHINYRKTFIAIKIENPRIYNKLSLKLLEESWGADVAKIITPQGWIYRIKFA